MIVVSTLNFAVKQEKKVEVKNEKPAVNKVCKRKVQLLFYYEVTYTYYT